MNPSIPVPFPLSLSIHRQRIYYIPWNYWTKLIDWNPMAPRDPLYCRLPSGKCAKGRSKLQVFRKIGQVPRCLGGTYHQPRMENLWNSLRRGAILMPSSKSFLFAPAAAQFQLGRPPEISRIITPPKWNQRRGWFSTPHLGWNEIPSKVYSLGRWPFTFQWNSVSQNGSSKKAR